MTFLRDVAPRSLVETHRPDDGGSKHLRKVGQFRRQYTRNIQGAAILSHRVRRPEQNWYPSPPFLYLTPLFYAKNLRYFKKVT
jgi:hypothetical protein